MVNKDRTCKLLGSLLLMLMALLLLLLLLLENAKSAFCALEPQVTVQFIAPVRLALLLAILLKSNGTHRKRGKVNRNLRIQIQLSSDDSAPHANWGT